MILNNSSRGLLVENEKALFIEYKIDGVTYFALPGGSLEIGETLQQCVEREFAEETGICIEVEKLILVNEFINAKPNNVVDSWKNGIHQIETIFLVKRKLNSTAQVATNFDLGMQGFKWLNKENLKSIKYYPEVEIDWFFSKKDFNHIYTSKK